LSTLACCSCVSWAALAPKVAITSTVNINFFILFSPFYYKSSIISVIGISLTSIVQVKSEAHDKELYQKFKQDIDNEVADMRDLLRQHIMLSDREEQLKPLGFVVFS
jgi:Holliday junction resolvase RusA-like endonuclease